MNASEFDSVAWMVLGELTSSSRSEKEAVPTNSRAIVDRGSFSFSEVLNSNTCSVVKMLDSMSTSLVKEVDATSDSEMDEVDWTLGSEMEEVV